jgi:hypothetical protein
MGSRETDKRDTDLLFYSQLKHETTKRNATTTNRKRLLLQQTSITTPGKRIHRIVMVGDSK